jgi:protein SCO1/2
MNLRPPPMIVLAIALGAAPAWAADSDPPDSLYHLDAALTDQAGRSVHLDVYRGHPVLVSMFYSSCPATCPLIIDTLRATERDLSTDQRQGLRVLLISIDPQRDTPAALAELGRVRHIDTTRWTLVRADEATIRDIAAMLDVQYRRLPNGDFNHSTRIVLLSPEGEIRASTSSLGHPDPALLGQLRRSGRRE